MKSIIFRQKTFLAITLCALALLIICFIAFDKYILSVALGQYYQWIRIIFAVLIVYYLLAITRSVIFIKTSLNKMYHVMAIIVSILALSTFAIDQMMLREIAGLYQENFGFSGEQRMLLVSLLIKFIALIVTALSVVKAE